MKLLESVEQLRAGLDYHLARHNLLTSNLAHVDTPGFRPKDLERRASFESSLSTALLATDARHFGSGAKEPELRIVTDRGAPAGLDGNAVSIDREAVKIASNNIRYETISALVADELSGLSWAVNDGRNG
jgi:flagellar basal-body rod protein FlgB